MHISRRFSKIFWLAIFLAAPAFAATPVISSFTVAAPNGEESASLSIKQGEQINFRWQLSGDLAAQLTISPNIGDVLGRSSKIIAAGGTGQITYTLTATNADGSASRQVTVNVLPPAPPAPPETLYNGITLSSAWPPQPADYPTALQPPAYLTSPPATIPVNVGRQLLVDDFLIESTTLAREFYPAQMHPGNPVLSPTTAVENSGLGPIAMPFSNGVFYDPAESLFKLWYMCGYRQSLCYATSTDGINWDKPSLDVVPGTNIVLTDTRLMDGYTTWIDLEDAIPARRYKLLRVVFNGSQEEFHLHYSADGIHWGQPVAINKALTGDRSTFFYNTFRKRWVLSMRETEGGARVRRYFEHKDLSFALNLIVTSNPSSVETLFTNTSKWLKSDGGDTAHPADPGFTPQLYDVDAAPYESLILGQMAILRGSADKPVGRPKLNEVYFGFSRDGFNWQRPNRQAMFSVNSASGSWNWGNVQPSAGGPIVVGDQLYFYFSGRGGVPKGGYNDGGGATGLAIMRRDGFASMYAGNTEGTLTTRQMTFNGKYLFVNADIAAGGSLCAEVLDQNNQVIAPFSKANCQSFSGNSTKQIIIWTGANDLTAVINTPVKLRFYLKNGKLYSFWVSPASSGISRGFVGAGGPEFGKYVDDGTPPPATASLTPETQTATVGQTVTLNYRTTNADSATLTPAIANCTINPNSTGSCSFTPAASGVTSYTLTATRGAQTATATASVSVNAPDTQPPTLTIAQLAATSTDQATITLTGTADDNTAVTEVNFSSDRGAQGQATGLANWTANVALQTGANVITVEAQDAAGNAGTAQVTITRTAPSDSTPPQITITAPTQNTFPLGTTQVSITATTDEAASCRFAPLTVGAGIFAAPNGSPANDGSFARPLDLATALSSASPARPGDTLWLRGGSYVLPGGLLTGTEEPPFRSVLTGTAASPITIRQFPGERAIVDGGIRIEGAYATYQDFEVSNSNTNREDPRPTGLNVFGHHLKLINLVVHEAGNGIGFWLPAEESEVYGALLYHNGWDNINDSRGSGHGVYAQNRNGTKRITDVISFDNYATGMKAYTEQGYADGIRFEGNMIFNNGRPARVRSSGDRIENMIIGSIAHPIQRSVVMNSYLYHPLTSLGPGMRIGYASNFNSDLLFKDNYIVGGSPSQSRVTRWNNVTMTGNTFIAESELLKVELPSGVSTSAYIWNNNQYYSRTNPQPFNYADANGNAQSYSFSGWRQATGLDSGSQLLSTRPAGAKVFVRPNQYQPGRYHIAVYNWDLLNQVTFNASSLLNNGERYELRNAQNYFGAPALSGTYNGSAFQLPMNGTPTGPEFNVFILISLDRQPQPPVSIPSFSAMTAFTQTGGQSHSTVINTQDGQSYNFAIRCSDQAGNISAPKIVSFSVQSGTPPTPTVDTTPPTVAINGAANVTTTQSGINLTGTAQDNIGVTQVGYSNDRGAQGTATGTTNWTATVALELGENIITVQATDAAGNVGSALVTVMRNQPPQPGDSQMPTVTINPPTATSLEQSSITLTGMAQDNIGVTQVSFLTDRSQQGAATGTSSWSASVPLELGQNVITVRAQDAAGNIGSAQITITRRQPSANANRAVSLDGSTGYVSIPTGDIGLSTKFWSLEAWINSTSQLAEFQSILGNRDGNELVLTQGKIFIFCYNGAFNVFYGTRLVNDGAWHHLTAVRNNDKLYLYIDGQADTDSETHQPFKTLRSTADNNFNLKAIGNRGTLSQWYLGLVDDVRVYGRALTLAEVQAHFNNGAGIPSGPDTGLRMGYNFDEESGAALDFSGNSKHGTLVGGVTRVLRNGGTPPPSTPQINSFTVAANGQTPAASMTITLGQSVTLAWQTANVQSATISGTQCSVSPLSSGSCQHTPAQTGQFTFTLTAQGSSATATATVSVTVNPPPQINSFTVAANGLPPASSATITLGQSVALAWQTANAQSASISGTQCSVAPLASGSCQHTPAQTGQFTYTLTGQGSGATTTASVSVTVNAPSDTQSPTVIINPPAATTTAQTSITLTGSAQDNVGVTGLTYQTDRGQQGQPSGINPWSATVPLATGNNIIIIRAQDAAGNFGSMQITITRTEPDTTPPQVTITAPTQSTFPAGTQQVQISASTNENSSCRISTNSSATFQTMTAFTQTGALAHTTNFAALDGASYTVYVRCADAVGNASSAQSASFSVQSPPPPAPGANVAVQLDGFTSNVAVPTGDNGIQTRFWTIEVWVKTNTQRVDFMTLVGNRSGNDLRMAGGQMILSTYNSGFTHIVGRRRINDNQWHHVVALRNGDRLVMYIDGQIEYAQSDSAQQGFVNISSPAAATNFNLKSLGNRGTADEWYAGLMDDVRLYTRALSVSEILAHYNNGQGIASGPDTGLFIGYDFNETSGNALDFSGNNRHGALQGAATRVAH
jgi:hypothetical protein